MSQRIPCTVITGFLGAGKTTLIQHLLRNPEGRRIALIINEFGDIGVDGDLIASCGITGCADDDVIELANGCICCTVADDFIPTLTKLIERDRRPDHIVIETSGLALPQPLLRAFAWPEVRAAVTVDGVVAVVDSEAVAAGRFAADPDAVARQRAADESLDHESPLHELFEDQVSCADLIVLSKSDLVDRATLDRVSATVAAEKRSAAKIVQSGERKPPASVLLGLGIGAETDAEHRRSHHEAHHHNMNHDDDDQHGDDHADHGHDAFESFVIELAAPVEAQNLIARVSAAGTREGVLRIKGFAEVPGKPMRLVVQAVGPRVETYFDRPWRDADARPGRLVVIGLAGLDRAALAGLLSGNARVAR
ncbi:MAG: cobalamin biosynthesis protein CobW [Hyphomicrobiaceae bacterium]